MDQNSEIFDLPEGAKIPKFRKTANETNAGWILRNARAGNDRQVAEQVIKTVRTWLKKKAQRKD